MKKQWDGMSITGFVLSFFVPILGVIFSAIGMSRTSEDQKKGHGLAVAGMVIAVISIVISLIFWLFFFGSLAA